MYGTIERDGKRQREREQAIDERNESYGSQVHRLSVWFRLFSGVWHWVRHTVRHSPHRSRIRMTEEICWLTVFWLMFYFSMFS